MATGFGIALHDAGLPVGPDRCERLAGLRASAAVPAAADSDDPLVEGPAVHRVASATERLSGRDFTELSPAELRRLVTLMREMTLAIPPRRTRRFRTARDGKRPD